MHVNVVNYPPICHAKNDGRDQIPRPHSQGKLDFQSSQVSEIAVKSAKLSLVMRSTLRIYDGPYLSGGQAVADRKAVDGDLDLALVDHVNDGLSGCVHRDDRHGEGTVIVSGLLTITFHLKAGE